ncbi:MAG: hypothetical protein ACLP66_13470 [Polyangia bacterium]
MVLVDVDDDAEVLDLEIVARRTAVLEPHLDIAETGGLGLLAGLIQQCRKIFGRDIDHAAGANPGAGKCHADLAGVWYFAGRSRGGVLGSQVFADLLKPRQVRLGGIWRLGPAHRAGEFDLRRH